MSVLGVVISALGLFAGSLLNLCTDRLPHGGSLNPPILFSPCCKKPKKLYERIPVLGYILANGKCAQCSARVSLRYPVMELASALAFFFLFKHYGLSLEFFVNTFFVLLLLLVSFMDLSSRAVPGILGIGGLSIGFLLAFFRKPLFFYQDAVYGIFVCGGILFVIAFCCQNFLKKEVLGFGDIIVLCTIGAFCGLKGAVFSLLAGSLLGTLIGIPMMLLKGKNAKYAIPFGPFLSLGALFFMSFGDRFIYAFLSFVSG